MKRMIFLLLYLFSLIPFAYGQDEYYLKEIAIYGSCWDYGLFDQSGNEIELPKNIQLAMKCPIILDLHDSRILTFKEGTQV